MTLSPLAASSTREKVFLVARVFKIMVLDSGESAKGPHPRKPVCPLAISQGSHFSLPRSSLLSFPNVGFCFLFYFSIRSSGVD